MKSFGLIGLVQSKLLLLFNSVIILTNWLGLIGLARCVEIQLGSPAVDHRRLRSLGQFKLYRGAKLVIRQCEIKGNAGKAIAVYNNSAAMQDCDLTENAGGA